MKKIMIIKGRIFRYRLSVVNWHVWENKKSGMGRHAPADAYSFEEAKGRAREFFTKALKSKNEL